MEGVEENQIENSFLDGDDQVEALGRGLKALRSRLHLHVPLQHAEQSVLRVVLTVLRYRPIHSIHFVYAFSSTNTHYFR